MPTGSGASHADAPPGYATATGSSQQQLHPQSLQVPGRSSFDTTSTMSDDESDGNHIPSADRASMEEEMRELPEGWIRQYDTK